jgi:hypothetical protein
MLRAQGVGVPHVNKGIILDQVCGDEIMQVGQSQQKMIRYMYPLVSPASLAAVHIPVGDGVITKGRPLLHMEG